MLTLSSAQRVYLASGATDLRKSIDGLAALVQESFGLSPFSASLFVFCNRERNKLKLLYWDHNGFWLFFRRLERGTFQWPLSRERTVVLSARELRWLLDGLSLTQRLAHPAISPEAAI
ncbi:IS66 family insertion sequence element accessory protein TnpB [Paenibacillus popilliae]|uniref:Transposase and inactivated derivative n=1 Tax=Paenibacillus popilliae ATCC 14706 TaxID=1212764 RepID=M9M7B6_PAEPP|nr:IS66 family insertion sequence element accessory protein TnpB [Paenibacillus popilliae]GAC43578.1 transposase and inactivated derivative [Paenibacillus popilliae ATCC 14706]